MTCKKKKVVPSFLLKILKIIFINYNYRNESNYNVINQLKKSYIFDRITVKAPFFSLSLNLKNKNKKLNEQSNQYGKMTNISFRWQTR